MRGNSLKKRKYLIQGVLYLLAFGVVFSVIDKALADNGKGYMINGDGIYQGYAVIGYIQSLIKEKNLFSGFDYSIGLGEDNLLVLSFYGVLNPIHWGMAWLLNTLATHILYKWILIVKFFLGGISFLAYANYRKRNSVLSVCASIIYAFSAWAISYGVNFIWYYDVLITLPILIMGIDKLFEKENMISFEFLCSMIYIGTQGFYFLFWQCLIAGGYFLIKILWERICIVKKTVKFGINCVCALLLVAPILFPNIHWFLSSTRNERREYSVLELLPSIHELKTFLRSFLTPTVNAWSHYLLITVALFAVVMFLVNFRKYKFEVYVLAISVIALITPGIGFLFNGGGYVSDRGFYFVWFILVYSILCGFEEILCLDKKSIFLSAVFVIVYSLFILLLEKEFFIFHIVNLIIFMGILGIIVSCFFIKTDVVKIRILLTGLLFLSTILLCRRNIFFLYDPNNIYKADYAQLRYAEQFTDLESLIEDEQKDYSKYALQGEEWFRVESDSFLSQNEGMLKGFLTTYEYWSICNPWTQKFFEEVEGLKIQNSVGRLFHESNIMKSFLGVRYYEFEGETLYNDMALPMAIGFTEYILEEQIAEWKPEQKQKILLQKIILKKESGKEATYSDMVENYSDEDFQRDVEARKKLMDSSTIISHNKIVSEINMHDKGYVMFTVPYSQGWSAYVDGEKVPVLIADYGFIGVDMLDGTHTVELRYRRPFQVVGWGAFFVGVAIFIYMEIYVFKRRKDR